MGCICEKKVHINSVQNVRVQYMYQSDNATRILDEAHTDLR